VIRYALVTPARDEAANLAVLAPTVIAQTLTPAAWVIVDDGSSDGTVELAESLAARHDWIRVLRTGRADNALTEGRREGRDLLALQQGIRSLPPVDTVTKLDADVALPADYFERLGAAFAVDPRLGLASGRRCEFERGQWRRRHVTGTAVEAQCRTYRWECWEALQPIEPRMGWDGMDEARAIVAGWTTHVVDGLQFRHRRPMGSRDGSRVRARTAEGLAAHFMGYRPSYLMVRAVWHARREPAALAMLWGYATAAAGRGGRCSDRAAVAYVRRRQSARHLYRTWREARGDRRGPASVLRA
jgi:glycosyltransferase involved in cell wall biosynthesis